MLVKSVLGQINPLKLIPKPIHSFFMNDQLILYFAVVGEKPFTNRLELSPSFCDIFRDKFVIDAPWHITSTFAFFFFLLDEFCQAFL